MNSLSEKKIYVAGHRGMVGSALVRYLQKSGVENIVTATRDELDLTRQSETYDFIGEHRPDVIVVAAAKVGGIYANNAYPAEFFHQNMMIAANLIDAAHLHDVNRLLFLGSSCIYPKFAEQPIKEDSLLSGALEPTNEAYAIAKIGALKMCSYYREQYGRCYHSAMPCNLYGIGDNYHPENSHVIPALIRRFHQAKESGQESVTIWGSGTPRREFLFADDLAEGCVHLLTLDNPPDLVNLGAGEDITIQDLATTIAVTVGYQGEIKNDRSKPDGTPRKLLDSSLAKSLGWNSRIPFREGLLVAYADYKKSITPNISS
ncbi:MAG: GDP-L-fucose synthase [Verrucomicrobiales bacterium]|nr:GDP-L-fucose synthase [Verrucomicrobiales bacterium]